MPKTATYLSKGDTPFAQRSLLIRCFSDSSLFTENEAFRFKINRQYNLKSGDYATHQVVAVKQSAKADKPPPTNYALFKYKWPLLTLHSEQTANAESPSKSASSGHYESKLCKKKSTHVASSNKSAIASSRVACKSRVLGDHTNTLNPVYDSPPSSASSFDDSCQQQTRKMHDTRHSNKENLATSSREADTEAPADKIKRQLVKYKIKNCSVLLKRLDYSLVASLQKQAYIRRKERTGSYQKERAKKN